MGICHARPHGQAQTSRRQLFGNGEAARLQTHGLIGLLAVGRHGIVNQSTDPLRGEMLLERIQGGRTDTKQILLQPKLVVRASTATKEKL